MRPSQALAVAFCAAQGLAQQWVSLDGPHASGYSVAFDSRRGRAVVFGIDGETWEFEGSTRLHRSPLVAPSPRTRATMTYDAARGHVLLFGGSAPNALADTWLWDGCTWRPAPFSTLTPPRRIDAGMTFDPVRNRVVMFGGADPGIGELSDTWEHDGSQWIPCTPATVPNPLESPSLAFDAVRGVCVLVVSGFSSQPVAVFEWNGVDWLARTSTTTPPVQRLYSGTSYDPLRRRTVLFGGNNVDNELWEWDGSAWHQMTTSTPITPFDPGIYFDTTLGVTVIIDSRIDYVTPCQTAAWSWNGTSLASLWPSNSPLGCSGYALFHDTARNRTVLHGGRRSAIHGETWEWDGLRWTSRLPATSPSARENAMACFDPVTATGLLFGGISGNNWLADCWRFDGTSWSQLPATPPARSDGALAWDTVRGEAILFGGYSNFTLLGDTWRWNGTAWSLATPATSPSARSRHAMAFDDSRGRMVLFGGGDLGGSHQNDTWEWDGTQWRRVLTAQSPVAFPGAAMVRDPSRGRMLLLCVDATNTALPLLQEWEYDGATWSLVRSQRARLAASMRLSWNPARQRTVLFTSHSVSELSTGPARAEVLGSGCGPQPPLLAARTRPRPGESQFGLELLGRANQGALFALAFGQGGTPIGNGCTLLLQQVAATSFVMANGSGMAVQLVSLPANQSLRGLVLFAQAGALDPAAPGGLALSHGLRLTVGD